MKGTTLYIITEQESAEHHWLIDDTLFRFCGVIVLLCVLCIILHVSIFSWGVFDTICLSNGIFTQEADEVCMWNHLHFVPFYVPKCAFERNRLWFWAAASFSLRSGCGRMKFQFDLGAEGWLRLRAAFLSSLLLAAGSQQLAPLCWSTMICFRILNSCSQTAYRHTQKQKGHSSSLTCQQNYNLSLSLLRNYYMKNNRAVCVCV